MYFDLFSSSSSLLLLTGRGWCNKVRNVTKRVQKKDTGRLRKTFAKISFEADKKSAKDRKDRASKQARKKAAAKKNTFKRSAGMCGSIAREAKKDQKNRARNEEANAASPGNSKLCVFHNFVWICNHILSCLSSAMPMIVLTDIFCASVNNF